jgi:TctA family transporter
MIKAISILNAVCLLIVLLGFAVEIPTFSLSFYSAEYDKYGIPAHIKVAKDDLMSVTDRLLAYMKGQAPDLVIETTVDGEQREFFNQREKDHMVDVKNLIMGGFMIRNVAAAFAQCRLSQ